MLGEKRSLNLDLNIMKQKVHATDESRAFY